MLMMMVMKIKIVALTTIGSWERFSLAKLTKSDAYRQQEWNRVSELVQQVQCEALQHAGTRAGVDQIEDSPILGITGCLV